MWDSIWSFTPAPGNDDFEQRTQLWVSRTHVATSNAGASEQAASRSTSEIRAAVRVVFVDGSCHRPGHSFDHVVPLYAPPPHQAEALSYQPLRRGSPPTCGNEIDQDPPACFLPGFCRLHRRGVELADRGKLPADGIGGSIPTPSNLTSSKDGRIKSLLMATGETTGNIDLYLH